MPRKQTTKKLSEKQRIHRLERGVRTLTKIVEAQQKMIKDLEERLNDHEWFGL